MTLNRALSDLNRRFVYQSDRGEYWRILDGEGQVYGDCEDYALTLIWLAEGRSLWRFWVALVTFKYVLWHVRAPSGAGHVVLWCWGYGWVDNITRGIAPVWTDMARLGYRRKAPISFASVAVKFVIRGITGDRHDTD